MIYAQPETGVCKWKYMRHKTTKLLANVLAELPMSLFANDPP